MNRIKNAIKKTGTPISLTHNDTQTYGYGVLYPVRYQQKTFGNISNTPQGRTENGRYTLFAETEFLLDAEYGDIISDNKNQYILLWKDMYYFKENSYAKACIKIITDRE